MKIVLSRILTLIFFTLGIIHFYWAAGGQFGFENTLPTNQEGVRMLDPQTIDCIIGGIVFTFFGSIYAISLKSMNSKFAKAILNICLWFIPIIFMLRAIGDFNYVGFFKEIKNTNFAYYDTILYSPLCLVIAVFGFVLLQMRSKTYYNQ